MLKDVAYEELETLMKVLAHANATQKGTKKFWSMATKSPRPKPNIISPNKIGFDMKSQDVVNLLGKVLLNDLVQKTISDQQIFTISRDLLNILLLFSDGKKLQMQMNLKIMRKTPKTPTKRIQNH